MIKLAPDQVIPSALDALPDEGEATDESTKSIQDEPPAEPA